jgi:ABC-type multidrug transport system ATPase subunit
MRKTEQVAHTPGAALRGVAKRFSRRGPWVLAEVDLELEPGTRTAVVGGNGSGKSTLLRIVAGLTRPTSGEVVTPGRVGYVPERLSAPSKLTGTEYVAHMGRIKGLAPPVIEARSRELFERLDLQPGPDVPSRILSKGNRQKLVLAQAFLAPLSLLILDEPYNGLDAVAHRVLGELMDEAQDHGACVLVSAHQPDSGSGSDRTLALRSGHLLAIDQPAAAAVGGTKCIVLTAPDDGDLPGEMGGRRGVISSRRRGRSLTLVVEGGMADELLIEAIGIGWSVTSVEPWHDLRGGAT